MKKFITIIALSLGLLLSSGEAIKTRTSLLRRNLAGDLHPKFRHLAELGNNRLRLKVDGKGMFAYRLKAADATTTAGDTDESSLNLAADERIAQGYDNAYSAALPTCTPTAASVTADADATCVLSDRSKGDATDCDFNADGDGDDAVEATAAQCDYAASAGTPGSPANKQRPAVDQTQLVYSEEGSLHVNRYGYLVDDNGLLLYGDGEATADSNEDMSIHIPSRAEAIIVTSTGQVLAQENGGAGFANCGQIKLARFANKAGLNVYDRIVSRCAAANKLGFALGNWCAGSELDGKEHVYYEKSALSGVAYVGNPRDLGFGKIVTL